MSYEVTQETDGSWTLAGPNGQLATYQQRPPERTVVSAIMDDIGVTDSSIRAAIQTVYGGVEYGTRE